MYRLVEEVEEARRGMANSKAVGPDEDLPTELIKKLLLDGDQGLLHEFR